MFGYKFITFVIIVNIEIYWLIYSLLLENGFQCKKRYFYLKCIL